MVHLKVVSQTLLQLLLCEIKRMGQSVNIVFINFLADGLPFFSWSDSLMDCSESININLGQPIAIVLVAVVFKVIDHLELVLILKLFSVAALSRFFFFSWLRCRRAISWFLLEACLITLGWH